MGYRRRNLRILELGVKAVRYSIWLVFVLFLIIQLCRHRVLAELLEHGLRSDLVLPEHRPLPVNSNHAASQMIARPAVGVEYESARSLGINPSHALHHPGFYYYVAARCTELRRKRFLAAVEAEVCCFLSCCREGFYNWSCLPAQSTTNGSFSRLREREKGWTFGNCQWTVHQGVWAVQEVFFTVKPWSRAFDTLDCVPDSSDVLHRWQIRHGCSVSSSIALSFLLTNWISDSLNGLQRSIDESGGMHF